MKNRAFSYFLIFSFSNVKTLFCMQPDAYHLIVTMPSHASHLIHACPLIRSHNIKMIYQTILDLAQSPSIERNPHDTASLLLWGNLCILDSKIDSKEAARMYVLVKHIQKKSSIVDLILSLKEKTSPELFKILLPQSIIDVSFDLKLATPSFSASNKTLLKTVPQNLPESVRVRTFLLINTLDFLQNTLLCTQFKEYLETALTKENYSLDFYGNLPLLSYAILQQADDAAYHIIKLGADTNRKNYLGFTPLHLAALCNNSAMITSLINKGAYIEGNTREGLTPLHCAAYKNKSESVKTLINLKANLSAQDSKGGTPLHHAVARNNFLLIDILCNQDTLTSKTYDGYTPLHIAAQNNCQETIKLLINQNAQINAKAKNKITPLHLAAFNKNVEALKLLIENNAIIDLQTDFGSTALHLAAAKDDEKSTLFLLSKKANTQLLNCLNQSPADVAQNSRIKKLIEEAVHAKLNKMINSMITQEIHSKTDQVAGHKRKHSE